MPSKDTTPLSLYGNDREYLREQERTNELLADIAGETYESPGNIPNGKYILQKRMLDAAQKKNELLESIAGGGGAGGGAAKGIDIDYGTDVISLTNKDGDPIQGSGATLPAYGFSFDPTTGGLTLTKNGTAMQGQTVTIPNYGSPVGVTSASDMTDHGTIYLYEGTTGGGYTQGHFYWWDGTAWADGGEYAAATVQTDKTLLVENRAADAKATGEAVGELKTQLNTLFTIVPPITFVQGTINSVYGTYDPNNTNRIASDSYIDITNKTVFDIPTEYDYNLFFYKGRVEIAASNYLSTTGWLNGTKILGDTIVIPSSAIMYKMVVKYHGGNTIPIVPADFTGYRIQVPGYDTIKTELEVEINETKTELESELDYKIKNTDVVENRTLINGSVNSNTGAIDTNSTVRLVTKNPFLIEPNLSVKIADNFESAVFFYKVPRTTGSSYISNSNWISGNYRLGEDVAIPDTAEYVWISIRNKANPSSTIVPSDVTDDDFIVWRAYEKLDANNVDEYAIGLSATPNITFLCRDGMVTPDVPPNSKYAIKATAENQYDKIRLSVNKTYDNYYVCVHDATINNLAVNMDGTAISDPVSVRQKTLEQLNGYDWGLKYGEEYAGLHVPELEDCLAWASKYGLTIALDIKFTSDVTDDDVNNISALLSKYAQLETIFFAINIETMQRFYAKSKRFSYLFAGELANITNAIKNDLAALHSTCNKIYLANRPLGTAPDSAYIDFAMANDFDIMYSPIEGLNGLKALGFDKGVSLMECHYIPNIKNTIRNYANSLMQS